jgi:hypothetical protein
MLLSEPHPLPYFFYGNDVIVFCVYASETHSEKTPSIAKNLNWLKKKFQWTILTMAGSCHNFLWQLIGICV